MTIAIVNNYAHVKSILQIDLFLPIPRIKKKNSGDERYSKKRDDRSKVKFDSILSLKSF